MAQGDRPLAVEAPGVGTAGGEVVGDAFNCRKVGRLVIET